LLENDLSIKVNQQEHQLTKLSIENEMTIYTALEHKTTLTDHLKNNKDIQIDLSGVTEIDCAGLQLLLFLKRQAIEQQINLTLTQHSQAVVEVFELLDLGNHFGDPIVISADWKQ
jgi:anti-sigma B factor antagonist